jgi:pyruvate,water dikinase
MEPYILSFREASLKDIALVGGKNASLGELQHFLAGEGIRVPEGFALTAAAYHLYLAHHKLIPKLQATLQLLQSDMGNLAAVGHDCRELLTLAPLPDELICVLSEALADLLDEDLQAPVAVRSSATAEDLPDASFAGQHDSFLNIRGQDAVAKAVHSCYVSLFNDRAIKYRADHGFDHMSVQLSVGVQRMVRSDKGASGVAFTIDPENGHEQLIYITGAWGLGEAVVQGLVNPDEYYFFKPALKTGKRPMIHHRAGAKEQMMVFGNGAGAAPVRLVLVNLKLS